MARGPHLHGYSPFQTGRNGHLDLWMKPYFVDPLPDLLLHRSQSGESEPPELRFHLLELVVAAQSRVRRDPRHGITLQNFTETHAVPQRNLFQPLQKILKMVFPKLQTLSQIEERLLIVLGQPKPSLQALSVKPLRAPIGENLLV